jgi:hypothetical protein
LGRPNPRWKKGLRHQYLDSIQGGNVFTLGRPPLENDSGRGGEEVVIDQLEDLVFMDQEGLEHFWGARRPWLRWRRIFWTMKKEHAAAKARAVIPLLEENVYLKAFKAVNPNGLTVMHRDVRERRFRF